MLKRFLTFVSMWLWIASAAGAAGLDFVPNVGQSKDGSAFSVEIPGAHVAFRNTSFDYTFAVRSRLVPARMNLAGANPRAEIAGAGLLPGIVNVHTKTARFSEIPTYGGLRYKSVYPGIDLEIDGAAGNLKSTWVVAPQADPARIRWRYEGFDHVVVDREGNLNLTLPAEPGEEPRVVTETAPVAWQDIQGQRFPVEVRYQERKDGSLSFEVGAYDEDAPLVIDPTLVYNRKVAGTMSGDGIAADAAGNVYLAGVTMVGPNVGGYVTKLAANGARQWITYFDDGTGLMRIEDVALGLDNQVYTAGNDGAQGYTAKLDNASGAVLWEHLGGESGNYSIAVDAQGNSYVVGARTLTKRTSNGGFVYATTIPIDNLSAVTVDGAGNPVVAGTTVYDDVHVSVLDASGDTLWSKVFGGDAGLDYPTDVAVAANGDVVVVGSTASSDFVLVNPVDGGLTDSGYCTGPCSDGFVTVLRSGYSNPIFSTFFGGDGEDEARGVAVDPEGAILIAGRTETTADGGFPMNNAIHPLLGGGDAFAARLVPASGAYGIDYSTPLGDPGFDGGWCSTLAGSDIYIGGSTWIGESPATAFVAKLRSNLLPSGDVVNINFQPEDSEVPEGYLPDSGRAYADRGNGWYYGWVPFEGRPIPVLVANELNREPDQQYDTYVGLAELERTVTRWEIRLKPGRYTVRLVAGDHRSAEPPWPSDWVQIYAEGVPFISEWRADGPEDTWLDRTVTVPVDDGRLTLTMDTRAEEWWLSLAFLEISHATSSNVPPKVSLTSPGKFEVYNAGRPVTLHAQASDSDGQVAKVSFYAINSSGKRLLLGTDTTAPYSVSWGCPEYGIPCDPGVAAGIYRLEAVAFDDQGAYKVSTPVDMSVVPLETKRDFFKVELKVFVPEETAAIPGSQGDDSQVARGDDRDFSSTSKEYRVLQQVTLIPSKALDEDGVMDGSTVNLHGLTAIYDLGSSVNPETGRLTQRARSESLIEANKGVPYMIDYGKLGAVSAVLPMPRPGSSTSDVRFDGLVFDPLVVGDCPLLWDLRVLVSVFSPSKPLARVEGTHGGFPAFELYIDGQPVYQWKPPAGETAERLCKPGSVEQVDTGLIFLK